MITVNTKPLLSALNLAIVNSNVSKYYKRSCLAEITIAPTELRINLEAAKVVSEITLVGMADTSEVQSLFVDNLLLKQLISTLTSATVRFDVRPDSLEITSGKSRFTLPKLIPDVAADISLKKPSHTAVGDGIALNKDAWRFVKESQMYALSKSFLHPVYTRAWVSNHGDVLIGDFDESQFTHSLKSDLGHTCLLSDTIINLLDSLPEGATLYPTDVGYAATVETDGYKYITEFIPESEADVGSYNADIILDMMNHPDASFAVSAGQLNHVLNQSLLLSSNVKDTIKFEVSNSTLRLVDANVDCSIDIQYSGNIELEFITARLKSAISSYGDVDVRIGPSILDDEVTGIVIWNDEFTTALAGV